LPPTSTRLDIEEEVVRILGQRDPETAMVPVPINGTIALDGTTITSPLLDRGTINANRFDGRLIKVTEDATALAYAPAVTVTGAHSATTTTLTVSSTTDIAVGHVLEIGTTLEKVLVRAVVSATVLTVIRGYQGTTATAMAGAETVRYDPFGFITGVDNGGFAAGGILTVSPNFAADPAAVTGGPYAAGSFFLYPKGLHPDYVVERINSVLVSTDAPHLWYPSLVTDSDMSSADLTNWDVVAAGTRVFTTTPADILYGERALTITAGATDDGIETEDFDVTENEQMIVLVHVKVTAGSGKVILRRVTATAANLKTVTTLNERVYTDVFFRETVPDGMLQAAIQVLGAEATSTIILSPHVVVQSDRRRAYAVPSWWTRENQLKEIVAYVPHYSSDVADSYISLSRQQHAELNYEFTRSERDANPLRVEFANCGSYPVGFLVQRPFTELVGDSSTTVCDKYYAAFKAVSNILRDRQDNSWKHWAIRAASRAKMLGYGGREVTVREQLSYAEAY